MQQMEGRKDCALTWGGGEDKAHCKAGHDFFMENRQILKVSILNDLYSPQPMDNTMRTAAGFERGLSGGEPGGRTKLEAFLITVIMQAVFLRKDVFKESMGIDFYCKKDRDAFLGDIIEKICGGRSI